METRAHDELLTAQLKTVAHTLRATAAGDWAGGVSRYNADISDRPPESLAAFWLGLLAEAGAFTGFGEAEVLTRPDEAVMVYVPLRFERKNMTARLQVDRDALVASYYIIPEGAR